MKLHKFVKAYVPITVSQNIFLDLEVNILKFLSLLYKNIIVEFVFQ